MAKRNIPRAPNKVKRERIEKHANCVLGGVRFERDPQRFAAKWHFIMPAWWVEQGGRGGYVTGWYRMRWEAVNHAYGLLMGEG